MSKYRKKPVVIEAHQFRPIPGSEPGKAMFMQWPVERDEKGLFVTIPTLDGNHRADPGDMIITGVKGEQYPCKPDIFALTYDAVVESDLFGFGDALNAVKAGKKVSRSGWNGKGMWIAYSPGSKDLPADRFWNPHNKAFAEARGGTADVLPCITMKNAQDTIMMGWAPTCSDMLADDWMIVE